jgi:predicted DNA-binding transcriptional regulator YafY
VQRVVVRLKGWAAAEALERRVHDSQAVTRLPKGEARVALEVAGLEEVTRWVLGFGSLAVVESPPELVAAVVAELDRAVDGYESASASGLPTRASLSQNDTQR